MPSFKLGAFRSLSTAVLAPASPAIGIDLGTSAIKLLQVAERGEGQPQLIAAASIPVPENLREEPAQRLEWQLGQIPELVRKSGSKGKRVVCSVPSSHLFCKHLQVVADGPDALQDAVRGTVAAQLGCGIDAIRCRGFETGATPGGRAEVIAMAVAQGVVKRLMDSLTAAKLEPVGIQPESLAMLRSFDHITRRANDHETTSLYIDLGAGTTRVLIAHGTSLVFAKSIAIGGQYLDQTASRQLKCPLDEARRQRLAIAAISSAPRQDAAAAPAPLAGRMSGRPAPQPAPDAVAKPEGTATDAQPEAESAVATMPEARLNAPPPGTSTIEPPTASPMKGQRIDLAEPLDTLTDEIQLCLRYHQNVFPGRRPNRVVFVGGEARHTALCQHIARVLKTAAHVADPLSRLSRTGREPVAGVDINQPQPGWAVALGLCLGPTDL
jgi:type IV pilus assembly protein PilM